MKSVLVTGGAGYIGSHMVKMLGQRGYHPVTLDDLSNGHRDAVLSGDFIEGNIADETLLAKLFDRYDFCGVLHFASYILVGESMKEPEKYFQNNVENMRGLVAIAAMHHIPFIFSSTAAVYGQPDYTPIDEKHPKRPVSVYGETKLKAEGLLEERAQSDGLVYGVLRYFNAAGADPDGELGERHDPETHLIPLVLQAASGKRDICIFGDDYDTPDGTCLRDYIHIVDLADAHIRLLDYLQKGGTERVFNLGTGEGYSVREVIDRASAITGKSITPKIETRREGDPAVLIADGSKARKLLQWEPRYSDLDTILSHAWQWEKQSA